MSIDLTNATYGAELEMADIDTTKKRTSSFKYDFKDFSICNSNGTANDPKKLLNRYGSELHTRVCDSPEKLWLNTMEIYDYFRKKDFNWSTNLHVHVHVPGLRSELKYLKRLAEYDREYGAKMFELIDPIPEVKDTYILPEELAHLNGAKRRYKRRKRSHHYQVSDVVYLKMMNAKTSEEFYLAHAPLNKNGVPQWQLVQRAGVSLMQLWRKEASTIEFRCFTMSRHLTRMASAYKWCQLYLQEALHEGDSPKEILRKHPDLKFQKFHDYHYRQDRIFRMTNFHENSRKKVEQAYRQLVREGTLKESDIK